jgi:death on curing protein
LRTHLTKDEVIAIHEDIIDLFGGMKGILNEGTLEYAVQRAVYEEVLEEAAVLLVTIAQEHPFMDGNKRTAFVVAAVILRLNGFELEAEEEDSIRFMIDVARGELGFREVTTWLTDKVKRFD